MDIRVIGLFEGIGGFKLGAQMLGGFQWIESVEIDPASQAVLRHYWPDVPVYGDIRSYKGTRRAADLVVGGFPCTGTSQAGSRSGLLHEDSGLMFELLRVVCEIEPSFVVVENPSGFADRGLRALLGGFGLAGYESEVIQVRASDLGAIHKRDRLFVCAHSHNLPVPQVITSSWKQQVALEIKRARTYRTGDDSRPDCVRLADGLPRWMAKCAPWGHWASHQAPRSAQIDKRAIEPKLRHKMVNQYGLAVCPQQAAIALSLVRTWWKYLYLGEER